MSLFLTITQRIHLLGAHTHRTSHPKLVLIHYQLKIELATVMNAVNYHSHQIVKLERHSPHSVSDADIRYLLKLFDDFLEEKVSLSPRHFRQRVSIPIDLPSDGVLSTLEVTSLIIVILRFHNYMLYVICDHPGLGEATLCLSIVT